MLETWSGCSQKKKTENYCHRATTRMMNDKHISLLLSSRSMSRFSLLTLKIRFASHVRSIKIDFLCRKQRASCIFRGRWTLTPHWSHENRFFFAAFGFKCERNTTRKLEIGFHFVTAEQKTRNCLNFKLCSFKYFYRRCQSEGERNRKYRCLSDMECRKLPPSA